ncbi:MAG: hypothetical protein WD894_14615 [Pirellulales bacterium]
MYPARPLDQLQRYFAGLTEHAFQARLGVADPPLLEYLSNLLVRFVHCDTIYRIRNLTGTRLLEVADMLAEAEARIGESKREVHRHIGDFTLFWSGVFPEALRPMRSPGRKDALLDYCQRGKRSYYIASTIRERDDDEQSSVLERLSHDFELCVYGLGEVRREWERADEGPRPPVALD